MASNIRNPFIENQKMTTKPKKVVIKKKAILATPEIEFKTTKEKGDAYEIFIKHYLIDTGNYKSVYLWKDVPEADLFACGIMDDWNTARIRRKQSRTTGILPDFGTDLLVKSSSGDKYSIVQCKHYDESRPLSANDLGTFLCMVMRYHKQVSSLVYSSSGYQNHLLMLEDNYNITYNELKFNPARYLELLNTIYKPDVDKENSKILIPYDYQLEAINALKGKDRTVCQLPCGCGKTLIAIKLCEAYKQNVIITPLKSYCEQNLDRFTSQMDGSYAMMIIDSDGDGRNIDKIQEFVKKNNKICLFATFKSVDIINKLIGDGLLRTGEYYIVIDEFHNLSINDIHDDILEVEDDLEDFQELENVNLEVEEELDIEEEIDVEEFEDELEDDESIEDNNTEMYKLLHSNARILFMSATPRLYGDDIGYSEDCDIEEEIFGNIDYKMPMHEAITSGKICDYMVYVPTLSIEKTVGLDKIQEEVDIHGYDKELVIKARFLLRGMMNNGSKRCIIYLQTQEECRKMNTILTDIGKNYFGLDINSNYLISDLGREERKLVLKAFIDKEGYNFICSVDILNECIDIPECDSIFIAYPSKSKIRNIQRVCRANRKDKKNVDKVARIYVWADEYKDDLVDFIGHLKEYDESFTFEKIKRVNVNGKMDAVMRIDDDGKENKKLEGLVVGVKGVDSWMENLEIAYKKLRQDKTRPSSKSKNKEDRQIGGWIVRQQINYKNKTSFMSIPRYYEEYTKFINEFSDLLKSSDEIWFMNRNNLRSFILTEKKLPKNNKNNLYENKLWHWMRDRIYEEKFNKFNNNSKEISWKELTNECIKYFTSNKQEWIINYNKFSTFIIINKRLPKETINKYEKKLKYWYYTQEKSLKFNLYIMKNDHEIKQMYIDLKNTYSDIMISFEELWKLRLKAINEFKKNNKNNLPKQIRGIKTETQIEENTDSLWLKRQEKGYQMNNFNFIRYPELKIIWEQFRCENIDYFKTSDDIWKEKLIEYKNCLDNNIIKFNEKYSDKYSKLWFITEILPNNKSELYCINCWGSRQQSNRRLNKETMKNNQELRQLWDDTVIKYGNLFPTYKEELIIKLNIIEQFILEEERFPIDTVKSKIESQMRIWFRTKKSNFETKTKIFKDEDSRKIFKEFIDKYNKYL
jgi:superfamily II DNA or RNA helicase